MRRLKLKASDGNKEIIDASLLGYMVTPEELAKLLKVPMSWIYDRTRKSGPDKLPFYKMGRYLRFSVLEIEDYLRQRSFNTNGFSE